MPAALSTALLSLILLNGKAEPLQRTGMHIRNRPGEIVLHMDVVYMLGKISPHLSPLGLSPDSADFHLASCPSEREKLTLLCIVADPEVEPDYSWEVAIASVIPGCP